MIEILKHGKIPKPEKTFSKMVLYGKCSRCGCKVKCTGADTESCFDPTVGYLSYIKCPDCGELISVKEDMRGRLM